MCNDRTPAGNARSREFATRCVAKQIITYRQTRFTKARQQWTIFSQSLENKLLLILALYK